MNDRPTTPTTARSLWAGLKTAALITALVLGVTAPLTAQRDVGPQIERYVSLNAGTFAITGVTLIDGTGAAARTNQTVLVEDGRITAVGPSGSIRMSGDAEVVDGSGHTLIPGMMGLHNHLYYTAAGGRGATLTYSAPAVVPGCRRHHGADDREPSRVLRAEHEGRDRR